MRTLALALALFSLAAAASAVDIHKLKRTAVAYNERQVGNYFTSISNSAAL
jgi:predicted porin